MNKRMIAEMAKAQKGGQNVAQNAAIETPAVDKRPTNGPECGGVVGPDFGESDMVARLYVALIGGADWVRTQASDARICRLALARARLAARIFAERGPVE